MHRSTSSESFRIKVKTPEYHKALQSRHRLLLTRANERQRQYTPNYCLNKQFSQKQTEVTPFRETGITYRYSRGFSCNAKTEYEHFHFENNLQKRIPLKQKFSSLNNEEERRAQSQHRLILNVKKSLDKRRDLGSKNNFLRKGSGINRSIMLNILKSGCNKDVKESVYSHSNHPANEEFGQEMRFHIPAGMKDVIGTEQLLKMTNIFTGGTIKSVNLHIQVKKFIEKSQREREGLNENEEMTLKSIRRW